MKLSGLLGNIAQVPSQTDVTITGIQTRAQDIVPGQLFLAIKGYTADGHDFIRTALDRGAAAVVAQYNPEDRERVIVVNNSRRAAGIIAARFYGDPSKDLFLTGVTGTNGKTTITYLLEQMFLAAGHRCGVMGTINIRYDGRTMDTATTTPDALTIQKTLFQMKQAGITHVIMEVSSHGLDQFRVDGCCFDLGIFTNLTQDHLDYHPDMTAYYQCKKRFFTDFLAPPARQKSAPAVINIDDPWGARLAQELDFPVIRVSAGNVKNGSTPEVVARDIMDSIQGIAGRLCLDGDTIAFSSPLTGRFNLENILCAAGAAHGSGIALNHIQQGLASCTGVPGRLEKVANAMNRYLFVDYAHTPNALESVLKTLKQRATRRLITVFGCGGDRDHTKRPVMGKIACRYSDVVIVTSDNPRSEDPEHIIRDILAGIRETKTPVQPWPEISDSAGTRKYEKFIGVIHHTDRNRALSTAVRISRPGDIILAAGKGHETYQITREGTRHFDDREQLSAACNDMAGQYIPIPWTRNDITAAVGVSPVMDTLSASQVFKAVSTDSRTIQSEDIFLALAGDTFDGHRFVPDLAERGIQGFVVNAGTSVRLKEKTTNPVQKPGRLVFEVPDTLTALGLLGHHQRMRSGTRVLAITGSNGKTSTRRMAQTIFQTTFETLATQKNFNNEIGVPKTLLNLSDAHEWAVVEMGMNQPGEMARLSRIAAPDICIVTNTTGAHLERLKTAENVAREKACIFDHAGRGGVAVIFNDDPRAHILTDRAKNTPGIDRILTFGNDNSADVYATDIQSEGGMTRFLGHIQGETARFHLHSPARFMVLNALASLAAAAAAGIRVPDMQAGLAAFTPVSGRMQIQSLPGGIHLINDTYNANPASVTLALKTLAELAAASKNFGTGRTLAILGDMLELGPDSEQHHRQVGKTAGTLGISRLYLFGPLSRHTLTGALDGGMTQDVLFHGTKQEITDQVSAEARSGDWVLVKGSRGMAMETIIEQWETEMTGFLQKTEKD
ncbi:MAG: UDP-N-acetylmuramoyl-L-alanyl-D-glutamate--2,6-diaminopimelate ligase [Desulfotignum sp.]